MMENNQQFVRACKSYGVAHVFLPGELVGATNLMNVMSTIHSLATLAEANGFTPVLRKTAPTESQKPNVIRQFSKKRLSFLREESGLVDSIHEDLKKETRNAKQKLVETKEKEKVKDPR